MTRLARRSKFQSSAFGVPAPVPGSQRIVLQSFELNSQHCETLVDIVVQLSRDPSAFLLLCLQPAVGSSLRVPLAHSAVPSRQYWCRTSEPQFLRKSLGLALTRVRKG